MAPLISILRCLTQKDAKNAIYHHQRRTLVGASKHLIKGCGNEGSKKNRANY